jgi:hypothetical protein
MLCDAMRALHEMIKLSLEFMRTNTIAFVNAQASISQVKAFRIIIDDIVSGVTTNFNT